jgi:hypothetical protein
MDVAIGEPFLQNEEEVSVPEEMRRSASEHD